MTRVMSFIYTFLIQMIHSVTLLDNIRQNLEKRPDNVMIFQDQVTALMRDSELFQTKKAGKETDDMDERRQETYLRNELPSPTFKTNFAELDDEESHDQKIKRIKLKEERLATIIRNAKKELAEQKGDEEGRKQRMHNIVQLQMALKREKRLVLGHQQEFRIHAAKLWHVQYHAFEVT